MGLEMFYNKTVTLFNRSFNEETEEEKYYPTLLENVNLVETKGANVSKSGMDSADAATLFVDLDNMEKPYLEPKAWAALPDEEKSSYITFAPAEDFFVKGSCTGATLPESGAYEWMRDNFDAVYKVTHIDRYEDILPHLEVGGA
ncbi:MAG: hypothetical protein MSA09_03580 [Lachnospiraceae bacterium]|nr:hypothetical protein [Lachnospiraceae bacterium]